MLWALLSKSSKIVFDYTARVCYTKGMSKSDLERLEILNPNLVHIMREHIAQQIEAISLGEDNEQLNGLGMRMIAAKVARGE